MDSFVYRWTNLTLNKTYTGWHKGTEDDGYVCSSASDQFWADYNNPSYQWQREILFKGTMPECQLLESQLLDSIDITSDSVYNNRNNIMFNLNDEVRNKLSKAAIKRSQDPLYIKKLSDASKRQWANPEHRKRISKANSGKIVSEETKNKIRKARKLQVITPESRAKVAEKLRGRKCSQQHKDKLSAARLRAPVAICPHCKLVGKVGSAMTRWHFDACKNKPTVN